MIFRNLTKKCFSIRYRGKTVEHFTDGRIYLGNFHVGESGRLRAQKTGHKTIHAGVKLTPRLVAEDISYTGFESGEWRDHKLIEVTYNPKEHKSFIVKETGQPLEDVQYIVIFEYPRIFIITF